MLCLCVAVSVPHCSAETVDVEAALFNVRVACDNISGELDDIKKKAGIGTAVSGVGVAAGTGAAITGFSKASKDKQIEQINIKKEQLKAQQKAVEARRDEIANSPGGAWPAQLMEFRRTVVISYADKVASSLTLGDTNYEELERKSKKLGNIRTGLMAGTTVTNTVGAILAGGNKINLDLQVMIDDCVDAVNELRDVRMRALAAEDADITQNLSTMDSMISACGAYETVDVSAVNGKAKGAMVSSIVGAGLGLGGTVTSAVANTNAVRNSHNDDGSDSKTAKGLNTASNVLAIGTAGASAVATVFNATQISAAKKIVEVAEKCEDALR